MTGRAPAGSRTPPIVTPAERWTRAPTCAQEPDQHVRVHHRVLADPRPDVDVRRRHDHDARAEVHAGPDGGAARDHSPRAGEKVLDREPGAIAEPERAAQVPLDGRAVPEAGEDRGLDLGVGAPPARGGGIRAGGAPGARVEVGEDRGRRGRGHRRRCEAGLMRPRSSAGRPWRPPPATRPSVRSSATSRSRGASASGRSGWRRRRRRGGPSRAWRPSPGPGSGRPGSWRAGAAASGRGAGASRPGRRRATRRTSAAISPGISLLATEITPSPPIARTGKGRGVVAREHRDVARPVAADHGDLLDVRARLLHRHDPRVLGEPQERVGLDVRARPARDGVHDDRQAALVRDRRGSGPRASAGRACCSRA